MAKRISIKAPEITPEHPAYQNACRSAIEPSVTKLLQLAADVGWEPKQAAFALMFVAASSASDGPEPAPADERSSPSAE